MSKVVLSVLVAFATGASWAGWESWLRAGLYRASFESYEKEQPLSDIGATNGTWTVPASATTAAAADPGPSQYIEFSTEGHGLVFTPKTIGDRVLKSVVTSARLAAYEEGLPDLTDSNPRGAFAIHAPENGATNFVGWTADGWVKMESDRLDPVPGQWYDVSMKYVQTGAVVRVQYRLKRQDDADYIALHAIGDPEDVWFVAGRGSSDAIVSTVELQGEGAFSRLTGSEPRRGLLIGLVPWREMLIDESVYHKGSGDWYVFDYATEKRKEYPGVAADGDAYIIAVPEGESYTGFKQKKQESDSREVIEFTVCFMAPNDNDATPTNDVCALVRLVEMPLTDVKDENLVYQFACLANGGWHTNDNTKIRADVNADYTVEITLDRELQSVAYRIKQGRGAEAGAYQELMPPVHVAIGDPLFSFFGGVGKVYSIKATTPTAE